MAVWKDMIIPVNGYARSGQKITAVRKIVMHYTANNGATAMNHYNYFKNLKDRYASAHFFVDKLEALCIIPLSEIAYHANDVQKRNSDGSAWRGVAELKPNANFLSIGIEMCVEKDGTFHPDTIKRAEDVALELCKRYGLDPLTDIVRHRDVTYKNCPAPWVANPSAFDNFKKNVNVKFKGVAPAPAKPTPAPTNVYRVRKSWADVDSQIGAYSNLDSAKELADKNAGYEVYDKDGKVVYPIAKPAPAPAKSYTVVDGDTFYSIAKKVGLSVAELQKFNPRVDPAKLHVGDVIYLYAVPQPAPAPAPAPAKPVEKAIGNLVVKADKLNIRKDASFDATVVGTAIEGAKFPVYESKNGLYRIGDGKWVSASSDYVTYTSASAPAPKPAPKPVSNDLVYTRTLKRGMTGNDVKALQTALNKLKFNCGTPDGSYGSNTEDAVKRFQSVYMAYEVDGIAGKKTIDKINSLI